MAKGEWKHCWERKGDPFFVPAPDRDWDRGSREPKPERQVQKYQCKVCGAVITAACSGKIRSKTWTRQGVSICREELVKQVHDY